MAATDQGSPVGRYTLVPRTLIFITCGNLLLLLRGAPDKRLWAHRYNGLGGHVERGEDIMASAVRELREEAGLDIPDLWLCGMVTVDTGQDTGVGLYIFRGEHSVPEDLSSGDGSLEWVSQDEVYDLPLVEDLYTLLPVVLAMHPADAAFSAHSSYDEQGALKVDFFKKEKPIISIREEK
jgi:8-oxo-dGTP diphosphatase